MGYGYRSMKPEWKKDYAMEVEFDDVGCKLTLFSTDQWHFTKFTLTYEELSEWKNLGKFPGDMAWLRSEFVRQVLEDAGRADSMPQSGSRKTQPTRDYVPCPLHAYLNDLGEII